MNFTEFLYVSWHSLENPLCSQSHNSSSSFKIAEIFDKGDWHSFLIQSLSWHSSVLPLLQTNKHFFEFYRVYCSKKMCFPRIWMLKVSLVVTIRLVVLEWAGVFKNDAAINCMFQHFLCNIFDCGAASLSSFIWRAIHIVQ